MKTVTEIFSELREAVAQVSTELAASFNPGIPQNDVERLLTKIAFAPSKELLELYSLANGSSAMPGIELLPGAYFQSLEVAIDTYEITAPITEYAGPLANSLAVLTDHSGGGYGVLPEPAGDVVSIGMEEPPTIEFGSLTEMLELSLLCYREGVFTWAEFMTEVDWPKYEAVAQEFRGQQGNP